MTDAVPKYFPEILQQYHTQANGSFQGNMTFMSTAEGMQSDLLCHPLLLSNRWSSCWTSLAPQQAVSAPIIYDGVAVGAAAGVGAAGSPEP